MTKHHTCIFSDAADGISNLVTPFLFEKLMGKIYGSIINQDCSWKIRTNKEIGLLIKRRDIERCIRAQRLDVIGIL
jgi:hypothetical protein